MSLKVSVNARFLLPHRLEGLGRYTHEVVARLVAAHPAVEFHLFFDRPYALQYVYGPNVVPHVLFPPARHPLLYLAHFELAVAEKLSALRPAVHFSPDGYLILRHHTTPQVPVFHDLAFEHFPRAIDRWHRWHYRTFFPQYARRAAHVLTVSEATRQDIIAQYGTPDTKITVGHNGSSGVFRPVLPPEQAATRQRFSGGQPYFLYAGALHPRKNGVRLLRAFDAFKSQTGAPHRLLLTGRLAWQTTELQATVSAMAQREAVQFTGFVPDETLAQLYASAEALVYVSLFEGFGLPVLEAFHAETAVITSDTSSLPEVAGDAALLVNPYEEAAICQAMQRLVSEPGLRERLIQAGRTQRQRFSWDHTASTVWDVLTQVMQ